MVRYNVVPVSLAHLEISNYMFSELKLKKFEYFALIETFDGFKQTLRLFQRNPLNITARWIVSNWLALYNTKVLTR